MLTCGLLFAGGAWWLDSNKDHLKEVGQRAMQEGKDFAASSDRDGCVTEALRRLDAKGAFMEQVEHKLFLEACLRAAPAAASCEGVPARGDIMKSAQWAVDECARRGHAGNQDCGRLVGAVVEICGGK